MHNGQSVSSVAEQQYQDTSGLFDAFSLDDPYLNVAAEDDRTSAYQAANSWLAPNSTVLAAGGAVAALCIGVVAALYL